jgi:rare lipoprotein A
VRKHFSSRSLALPLLTLLAALVCSGCGHRRYARPYVPPPPAIQPAATTVSASPALPPTTSTHGRALYSEVGWASWYGPSYNHRRAANGEIYDQNGLTAAHRTLPLNSLVRVTNLSTGQSVNVRITDRGPFVTDRIIDLSMGAAKKIGVYIHGTAKVRLDLLESPLPLDTGGRWAVQMGAFDTMHVAAKVQDGLIRRYENTRVLKFEGPRRDWWVRVLVPNGNKTEAQEIARDTRVPEGAVFLVRLD